MKIKKAKMAEDPGFNMTPMIDVVFQLLIFFMLVTEVAAMEIERVYLPIATEAVEDDQPDKDRLIINVVHDEDEECNQLKTNDRGRIELTNPCYIEKHWMVRIKRETVNMEKLIQKLKIEGDTDRDPPPSSGGWGISNRPVMIRGDAGAPYKFIEKVFSACGRAKIWKIEIGATKPSG